MTLLTHFDSKNITSASLYSYTRFNPNHTGPRLSRVCFSQREIHYVAVNQGRWKLENWSQYKCPHGKRNPVYLHSLHTERTDEHINSKNWLNWLSRFLDVFSFDWFPLQGVVVRVLWIVGHSGAVLRFVCVEWDGVHVTNSERNVVHNHSAYGLWHDHCRKGILYYSNNPLKARHKMLRVWSFWLVLLWI